MRAKGYTFTTISGVIEAQNAAARAGQQANAAAGTGGQLQGGNQSGTDRLQAAHREATGATLYEGKALVVAVAVAEYTVPTLSVGLVIVGVAVMGSIAGVDGGAGATATAVALAAAVCAAVLVSSMARIRAT